MALNFYTQGIDFSGFGEGIAQGMRIATERKLQQDRLFDSEWKEYSRMFDPEKISDSDRKLYIDSYQKTREIAKALNRAERKGSVEEIDNLSLELKKYQGEMASVYGKSKMKNEKALRITKEIETAQKNGYNVDTSIKEMRNRLVRTPITELSDEDLDSDFQLDLTPKVKDLMDTRNFVDKTKTNFVRLNESEDFIDLPIVGKARIFTYTPAFISSPEANQMTIESLRAGTVYNGGVQMFKKLKAGLSMPDGTREKEEAIASATSYAKKAGLPSIDLLEPIHLTASSMGVYDPKTTGKEVFDTSDLTNKLKQLGALNAQQRMEISRGFLAASRKNAETNSTNARMYKIFGFLLKDGADAVIKNSENIREDMRGVGIDPVKFLTDLKDSKNTGLTPFELAARTAANAAAEEKK